MRTPEWYAMRMAQIRRQQQPKPVKVEAVKVKIEKPQAAKKKAPAKVKPVKSKIKPCARTKSITLPEPPKAKDILSKLSPETIVSIKGWGNYSLVYDQAKSPILTCSTLKKYQKALPDFIRIHKTYLVNPKFVKSVNIGPSTGTVTMQNGSVMPISRRRIREVNTFISIREIELG